MAMPLAETVSAWPNWSLDAMALTYDSNRADARAIGAHLRDCDQQFVPPLNTRVDLAVYSAKLATHATLFEVWSGTRLVGLVAGYANAPDRLDSFITNVSVLPDWHGRGIAGRLLDAFVLHARTAGFARVVLSVNARNDRARALYRKHGFIEGPVNETGLQMSFTLRTTQ